MTTWTKELARIPLHDSISLRVFLLFLRGVQKNATSVLLCRNGLERCCRSGSNVTGAPLARPANLRPKSRNPLFFHQLLRSASCSLSLPFSVVWRSFTVPIHIPLASPHNVSSRRTSARPRTHRRALWPSQQTIDKHRSYQVEKLEEHRPPTWSGWWCGLLLQH
jgi:hypothetical protein